VTDVYWISKMVVIEWRLTDLSGSPVNDATVTGTITRPDGTNTAATISHDAGSNVYRASYDPTSAGTHAYRLVATGTADSAEEGTFEVRPSPGVAAAPTLDPTTTIGRVRLLIPDRDLDGLLFSDADITAFLALEASSIKRAAALALETIASNEAMVGKVIKTQDLSTDGAKTAAELRARAAELRRQVDEDDPDAGGFDYVDFVDPFTRTSGELAEDEIT
jgi:hypothetical protein